MRQWRKRLLWGVLLLGGLYSIAWWGAAAWLQEQLTSPHRIGLLQAHCRQPAVTGFPFAMQVTCPTVQVDTPVAALNTGALEVQGSAWAPMQIRIDLRDTLSFVHQDPPARLDGQWTAASSTVNWQSSGIRQGNLEVADLRLTFSSLSVVPISVDAEMVTAALYPSNSASPALFLAASFGKFSSNILDLPDADLEIEGRISHPDATVPTVVPLPDVIAPGTRIDIDQLSISTQTMHVSIEGELIADDSGMLSGDLVATGREYAPLVKALFPRMGEEERQNFLQLISAFSAPIELDGQAARRLPLQVRNGQIFAGFWPLGQLPALF